jgi:SAM-dependent methyltransferase
MKVCLACEARFGSVDWNCPHCGVSPSYQSGFPIFAPDLLTAQAYDAEYRYADLFDVEASHFWFQSRNRLLIWVLRKYFRSTRSFLEIGCGTGFVSHRIRQEFRHWKCAASDSRKEGLEFAQRRLPGVDLFQMNARRIPFDEEFDLIGAFDVLEHISEDEGVLGEMFRATAPGGGIVITVPQHPNLWSFLDDFSCHKRRYTKRELTDKVMRSGFEVLRVSSFVSLLLPLLFFSRLRQPYSGQKCDPMAEFRINPLLNAALERIMDFERYLIKRGISFSAGGSLVLLARKAPRTT